MGTQKTIDPDEGKRLLAIIGRRKAGLKLREVAAEFGISITQARNAIITGNRYKEALAKLKDEPTDIDALSQAGLLPINSYVIFALEHNYGVTTLRQLAEQKWTRSQISYLQHSGAVAVTRIEEAMSRCGLNLAPDDGASVVREKLVRAKPIDEDLPPIPEGRWADREHVIEQCRRVRSWLHESHELLKNGRDNEEVFARISDLLRTVPDKINPLGDAIRKLEETERLKRDAEKALQLRRKINADIASFVAASGGGTVIQFPRSLLE